MIISYIRVPRRYQSTAFPWLKPSIISGTNEACFSLFGRHPVKQSFTPNFAFSNFVIFIFPLLSTIKSFKFKSLIIMSFWCKNAIAITIYAAKILVFSSENYFSIIKAFCKSPTNGNSFTKNRLLFVWKDISKFWMNGHTFLLKTNISLSNYIYCKMYWFSDFEYLSI